MDKKLILDWTLERYLLGDLPDEEHRVIAALEASDSDVRGRIDEMRRYAAEVLEKYPPEVVLPKIERMRAERQAAKQANKRQRGLKRAARLWGAVAACVAAVFIVVAAWKVLPPVISHIYHVYNDIKNTVDSINVGPEVVDSESSLIDESMWYKP